jgi:CheY-like chemotaxis protein
MRIVIAEDAALFRAGLVRLLEDEGHQVCAEVADGEALLAAVASSGPTWWSRTSGCRPRSPTRACAPRSSCA